MLKHKSEKVVVCPDKNRQKPYRKTVKQTYRYANSQLDRILCTNIPKSKPTSGISFSDIDILQQKLNLWSKIYSVFEDILLITKF